MRIAIATDAWFPQVNGVVRTMSRVIAELTGLGHEIAVFGPERFLNTACPTYPEIRLAIAPGRRLGELLEHFRPQAIHVSTEGPIGLAARRYALTLRRPFTTAYHTRFPEYVRARAPIPLDWSYRWLRHFHGAGAGIMVATDTIQRDLEERGFGNIRPWSRGVDTDLFRPRDKSFLDLPRPIHLYVGRVAVEKNIEAFLALDLPGSKLVVGEGPMLPELRRRFPSVHFAGARHGEDLARHYAAADLFVFPSRTDTFGLVMLEALASGLPVAAFPVPGPLDVIVGTGVGVLDEDLAKAARAALAISPARCREFALGFSWRRTAEQFLGHLAPFS
ncbi:MAG: glycosyltransferase family 1 protein [Rhodospirillaceae bacterium]|nr:glycosyltransferase family 1 protein [Rhodospirillaceae bacterium]